jgi:hypothetical protein
MGSEVDDLGNVPHTRVSQWPALPQTSQIRCQFVTSTCHRSSSICFTRCDQDLLHEVCDQPRHRHRHRHRILRGAWGLVASLRHVPPVWQPAVTGNPTNRTRPISRACISDTRPSHKTWLIQDDIPEIAQAHRLGHRPPGIRVYSHVNPSHDRPHHHQTRSPLARQPPSSPPNGCTPPDPATTNGSRRRTGRHQRRALGSIAGLGRSDLSHGLAHRGQRHDV